MQRSVTAFCVLCAGYTVAAISRAVRPATSELGEETISWGMNIAEHNLKGSEFKD